MTTQTSPDFDKDASDAAMRLVDADQAVEDTTDPYAEHKETNGVLEMPGRSGPVTGTNPWNSPASNNEVKTAHAKMTPEDRARSQAAAEAGRLMFAKKFNYDPITGKKLK